VTNDQRAKTADDASGPVDGVRVRLFDADRRDRPLGLDEAIALDVREHQLLWIDLEGDVPTESHDELATRFELDAATKRGLVEPEDRPHVALYGGYFHVRLAAEPDARDPGRRKWLDIVAGPNFVISSHHEPLRLIGAIDDRIAADATIGRLDSGSFVASMLDAVVTSYFGAVDAIEDQVDVLDAKALQRESFGNLFGDLVDVRRRIGRLRRVLAAHREVFGSLARRDFAEGTAADGAEAFQAVAARFEAALTSVEETREVVLGSFDVLMTRTSQRTNDVMRALTVATVVALPATIVASFLGMNVMTPFKTDDPTAFWTVVVLVVLVVLLILGVARLRRWL
jgi:magnesium transporter